MTEKEKLIDVFMHMGDHIRSLDEYGFVFDSTLAKAIEHVVALLKTEQTFATDIIVGSKWIPVSERLPKEFISVLVHIPEMNPCPPVMEAYRIGDGWVTKMAAFDINCATHWMPLPEPPAEDE